MGQKVNLVNTIEINGVELKVNYSKYSEPISETDIPYDEIELFSVRYNGRDVTDLIKALDVEEQIKSRL
jgi:hypothetical protein